MMIFLSSSQDILRSFITSFYVSQVDTQNNLPRQSGSSPPPCLQSVEGTFRKKLQKSIMDSLKPQLLFMQKQSNISYFGVHFVSREGWGEIRV